LPDIRSNTYHITLKQNIMPVVVTNIKAADPGVGFTIEVTPPEESLNNTLRAVVTLTNPVRRDIGAYTSEVWVKNPIRKDKTLQLLTPFGDNAYMPGTILQFTIELYMPFDAAYPSVTQQGAVIATFGKFNLGSNMIVKVEDFSRAGKRPSTDGMPMMVSEDGEYVGILFADGNFSIYPQYVLGGDKKIEAIYSSKTEDVRNIDGHPVSILLDSGYVYFVANGQRLFVSEQAHPEDTVYLAIRANGFFLVKPSTVYEPGASVGPLTFVKPK